MEDKHLIAFEVSGFKKFTNLQVDNIGQFNLIVGDNNVGKTTLLEALLVTKNSDKFLQSIFNILIHIKKFNNLSNPLLAYYFSNLNTSSAFPHVMTFNLTKNEGSDTIQYSRINSSQFTSNIDSNPFSPNIEKLIDTTNFHESGEFNFNVPYIPFGSLYNHQLTKQYSDHIQLFVDKKTRLVNSLSHIINNIQNIEVNTSYSNQPIFLIAEKGKNILSPLATYGDGAVKLFRILLSLFSNDHYSRLMIDELDTGVHYSRLKEFIKSLLTVAKEQKKQIFATTHSKECIEYFAQAVKELEFEEDARIIRLAETKSGIKAYTYNYAQFENALNAESELR